MALDKNTKYIITTISLVVLLYFAYQYYLSAETLQRGGDDLTKFILVGVGLLVLSGIVIIAQAYYRHDRFMDAGTSERATELTAMGALARDNMKHITIEIPASLDESKTFKSEGRLTVKSSRIHMPIRIGDELDLRVHDENNSWIIQTKITDIDGYNQNVLVVHR